MAATRNLQTSVPTDVAIAFKHRTTALGISIQAALEEAAKDWLAKTDPGNDSKPAGLLDEIAGLVEDLRRCI
jgi:hypothetical protein